MIFLFLSFSINFFKFFILNFYYYLNNNNPADALTTYTTVQWKYLLPFIRLLKEKELL